MADFVTPPVVAENVELTLERCPRCDEEHRDLEAVPLGVPLRSTTGGYSTSWSHWAVCPVTDEPVLVQVDVKVDAVEEREGS